MRYIQIQCLVWKTNEQLNRTAGLFCSALEKKVTEELGEEIELEYLITDVSSFEPPEIDRVTLVFGNMAASTVTETDNVWLFDDLNQLTRKSENQEARKAAHDDLKKLAIKIASDIRNQTHKQVVHAEKDGVTFGLTEADIQISEKEAEYLRNIKQLLGSTKIIIKKGDLTLEVSDE